jgi:ABC-2 type transport system permease protein
MKQYFRPVFGLMNALRKRFLRDKTSLFFTFLFPLIFLFIFGVIFGNNSVSFRIALINDANSSFAKSFAKSIKEKDTFKVSDTTSLADAKSKMSRGELDSVIELPKNFGQQNTSGVPSGELNVYYQKGSEQSGQTLAAVMQQTLDGINKQYGRPDAALTVKQVSTAEAGASSFDYTFSGLLGFSLMSMGIFGLANAMPSEKEKGSYRRLRAAPFKTSQLILANALHYLQVTLMSVIMMVIVGVGVFHFNMRGDWLTFSLFAVLSAVMVIGFGLVVGALANNDAQAAPIANLVSFPMMFLSGAFFPRFMFPDWLQNISGYIPLSPVIDGFRQIMTEHASLVTIAPQVGMILAWILVAYFIAMRFFRWGEHS